MIFSRSPATAEADGFHQRSMPETPEELRQDSRWPAFFPSPMCLVTTGSGDHAGFEKVVGPSIVNRFPYVMALSFCRESLSERHHARSNFTKIIEDAGDIAVQFLLPGDTLTHALQTISDVPDEETNRRLAMSGLRTRPGRSVAAPVLSDAYLVYEGRLVPPGKDFYGEKIFAQPWIDVGSHRIYFFEITAIQLRNDIAQGKSQILWDALPEWSPDASRPRASGVKADPQSDLIYQKGYNPNYRFPASNTVAFEADEQSNGMSIKLLDPLPENQIEVDNDRARWPCFFPSSAGMITVQNGSCTANLMPCGSTTVVSRHPMVIAPCISYSAINERYAPRASLELIRQATSFGCGVPYIDEKLTEAIRYSGTVSISTDPDKIEHAGLHLNQNGKTPRLDDLPIHFDCELMGEVKLGTHIMLLGEVKSIYFRTDLTPANPLRWNPWASIEQTSP